VEHLNKFDDIFKVKDVDMRISNIIAYKDVFSASIPAIAYCSCRYSIEHILYTNIYALVSKEIEENVRSME